MRDLAPAFLAKGEEFAPYLKMGRTQLQDAVPMTLGQEFTRVRPHDPRGRRSPRRSAGAHSRDQHGRDGDRHGHQRADRLRRDGVRAALAHRRRLPLITAPDLVEATADTGAFVQLSGVLKRCAVQALEDLQRPPAAVSSGPRAGLGEINLPAMQPGSSIMPGKVNPVIPEVVNQVCFDVIGGDVTVTMAAEAGQLQLNVFEPIIAYRLLRSLETLKNGCVVLRTRCVDGITANPARMRQFVEHSIGIVTALVPVIGYENATSVAKEALETGRGVYEVVLARGLLTRDELDTDPRSRRDDGRPVGCPHADVNGSIRRCSTLPVEQIRSGFFTDVSSRQSAHARPPGQAPLAGRDAGVSGGDRGLDRRRGRDGRDSQAVLRRLERAHRARAVRGRLGRRLGDGAHDRRAVRVVRASRDRSIWGARAAHGDLHERAAIGRSGATPSGDVPRRARRRFSPRSRATGTARWSAA